MSDVTEYKCPACGGAMEFDTASQKMKCPYCDTEIEVEKMEKDDAETVDNNSFDWNYSHKQWKSGETDNMSVFTCNSCGGEIVGDETTGATSCPFCGNPVVITGRFQGELKPDYIIPFKLDKKAAKAKYSEYIKGKTLLPKLFKDENHIDEIKGVYVPFWLYNSDINAGASFKAENIHTWSDSKFIYTETSIYDVYREGMMQFKNIPCDGSSKIDDDLMESIEPFDFSEAVDFKTAYMSGYFADKYDIDEIENEKRANDRILKSAQSVFMDSFKGNYTAVSSKESPSFLSILKGDVKYALYPVWMLTTTYKGEKYTFAMNGQTGKFVGNLPVDKSKKRSIFAGVFAGTAAVVTVLSYLLLG